jgi:hypothetical protein
MDAWVRFDDARAASGEAVWSRHPDAGVNFRINAREDGG